MVVSPLHSTPASGPPTAARLKISLPMNLLSAAECLICQRISFRTATRVTAIVLIACVVPAVAESPQSSYQPAIAGPSDEAAQAIGNFQVPDGLKVQLYAAEPLLANPVAFCFDAQGRCYVAETFRQSKGVEDNRGHMNWLDADLAAETVEDRLAYFKQFLGDKLADYTREHDRIRRLVDTNGDGVADKATVFADGFNDPLDGTGAGVIVRGDDVFYACIPHVWRLRDTNGDGVADTRDIVSTGYGVKVAFRGHDMHGFVFGPDGRLYYSIGDRGLNVKTREGKHLYLPNTGAVLRCEPDGSNLEIFAYGLRNPQELAFNDRGDLFTGDNNSDSGDKARWVHLVEGGNSGWLMSYQYLADRGPWNREKLWHPHHEGQAAYIVPPLANLSDGPSGLAYYPGTGLSDQYRDTFFLCDFRGTPGQSGVRTIGMKPAGASYTVDRQGQFIWRILATDVEFGPRGGVYVSDWVDGWTGLGKGRIYRVFDPEASQTPEAQQVDRWLAEGFAGRSADELAGLLGHADMRIRLAVQFELAARGESAVPVLAKVLQESEEPLDRRHALWGLAQMARQQKLTSPLPLIVAALDDRDEEIRAQAAGALGDVRHLPSIDALIAKLTDPSDRVRFFAAQSLGKLGDRRAVEPLLALLENNADRDPFLRHAAVMGLVGSADAQAIQAAITDPSVAVRRGVLLTLRRWKSPAIVSFLRDADPGLVAEAARAIYDELIVEALPALAELVAQPGLPDAAVRRAVAANFRLGQQANAAALAAFAGNDRAETPLRVLALQLLSQWPQPSGRDPVLCLWRPLEKRDVQDVQAAARQHLPGLFAGPAEVRQEAAKLAGTLGLGDAAPLLVKLALDPSSPEQGRLDAIAALAHLNPPQLSDVIEQTLRDDSPAVRAAATAALAQQQPDAFLAAAPKLLESGTLPERQAVFASLGALQNTAADQLLIQWLDRLLTGQVPADCQLDLLEAARSRDVPDIKQRLSQYETSRDTADPLAVWLETLHGGNAARGQALFLERVDLSCRRCHKVRGQGGDVGPDLSQVAKDKDRRYLLESIVAPSAKIAKNFETLILILDDGTTVSGIVKAQDDDTLTLQTPQGNLITVEKDRIDEQAAGQSAMPQDLVKLLSPRELRDLVEYLSTLK